MYTAANMDRHTCIKWNTNKHFVELARMGIPWLESLCFPRH